MIHFRSLHHGRLLCWNLLESTPDMIPLIKFSHKWTQMLFIISNYTLGIWICSQPRIDLNSQSNFYDVLTEPYKLDCEFRSILGWLQIQIPSLEFEIINNIQVRLWLDLIKGILAGVDSNRFQHNRRSWWSEQKWILFLGVSGETFVLKTCYKKTRQYPI